jgi:hypothetical protein
VLEAERDERVVGRVIDDQHRTGPFDDAGRPDVGGERRHLLAQHTLVLDRLDHQVAHVLERPAGVVVRPRIGRRVVLDREIHVRNRAIRLIAANDVIARFHVDVAGLERSCGKVEFQPLPPQLVDCFRRIRFSFLPGRNYPAVDGTELAFVRGTLVLQPVILEIGLLVFRDVVERDQDRRLLDVGVVARPPLDRRQRRIRAEPLTARHRLCCGDRAVVRAIAHDLVEPADGVVRVRDEEHVVRHPAVVEPVGPHAGHAALGHLHHFGLREHPPFVDRDRIDLFVVRPRAGRRIQVGLRFVQVVHDRRLPLEERLRHVPGEREELPHAIAVVVVRDVLAPIHQRQRLLISRCASLLVEVVGVDLLFTSVDLDDRRDQRDDVAADRLDERRVFHGEAIRQLDQHLWPAGLGRVHAAGDPVDGLRRPDQLLRLRFGRFSRIGERGEHPLVFVQLPDRRLVRNGEDHHVAPFLGLSDPPHRDAIRCLVEGIVVPIDVIRVRQLARSADDAIEKLQGGRNGVRSRQVVDELGRNPRVLQVLLDLRGVFRVEFLFRRGLG